MKFIIIGKNSYLAQKISNALINSNNDVFFITHNNSDNSYNTISFDRLDNITAKEFFKDTYAVINFAVCYGKNNENCHELLNVNTFYPLRILELAKENGVKYFINTATSITALINSYTLSKNQFSQWGKLYAEHNSIKFINIILEHYMGAGCSENNFITMLLHKLTKNVEYIDLTEGMQLRDFIYIDDVINAYMCIFNHLEEINDNYIEIPLGSGIPYRIKEISEYVKKAVNSKTELRFGVLPYRDHEIMYSCSDTTLLRKWGWKNNTTIENAIKLIVDKENLLCKY